MEPGFHILHGIWNPRFQVSAPLHIHWSRHITRYNAAFLWLPVCEQSLPMLGKEPANTSHHPHTSMLVVVMVWVCVCRCVCVCVKRWIQTLAFNPLSARGSWWVYVTHIRCKGTHTSDIHPYVWHPTSVIPLILHFTQDTEVQINPFYA